MDPAFLQTLRGLAGHLDRIDVPVYEAYGKDPLDPIVGGGDRRKRALDAFGRYKCVLKSSFRIYN